MTRTNRSNSGRSRTDSDAAIESSVSSGENATNPSSTSSFVVTNDRPSGPMTRLMALRMTMRRVQLTTHSLETKVLAMHSRKARLKHRFAVSEFAVSNRASLCKPTRSHSNTPTNSSLRAYSRLSFPILPNQRTFITLVSPYTLIFLTLKYAHEFSSWRRHVRSRNHKERRGSFQLHLPIRSKPEPRSSSAGAKKALTFAQRVSTRGVEYVR